MELNEKKLEVLSKLNKQLYKLRDNSSDFTEEEAEKRFLQLESIFNQYEIPFLMNWEDFSSNLKFSTMSNNESSEDYDDESSEEEEKEKFYCSNCGAEYDDEDDANNCCEDESSEEYDDEESSYDD